MNPNITPAHKAAEIRRILKREGSRRHAQGVQSFFKQAIQSRGWRTGDLRRLARSYRRSIAKDFGIDFLIEVANQLFVGRMLEEKIFAVLLLEKWTDRFDQSQFVLFESWIQRISSWADHDALAHYLIAPMIASRPERASRVFTWAKSSHRWHRRAACVALIHCTRRRKLFRQVTQLTRLLLEDPDDMVQKGLGWLLRETAKSDPARTVPFLLRIRQRAPRLVLRTACETLNLTRRRRVLASAGKKYPPSRAAANLDERCS
jgi:3-methyladenine DNA glycosylase AlkD